MLKFLKSVHWADKLVDVFVVVLSISIAFWLNNWRENSSNYSKEKKYLLNLSEDLAKDSANLAYIKDEMKDVFHDIERILHISPHEHMADSVSTYLIKSFTYDYFVFYPEDYTYKTLQQSGDIGLIKSDSIRQTLSHLYDNYEVINLLKNAVYDFQQEDVNKYFNNYDRRREKVIDPALFQTTNFDHMILDQRAYYNKYLEIIHDALEKHSSLQNLIREELEE